MKIIAGKILAAFVIFGFSLQAGGQSSGPVAGEAVLQKAKENAEIYRKGDVVIRVADAAGKPVRKAAINVEQVSHDFLFGALLFDISRDKTDPERETLFKERFTHLFNYGILPFYWGGYEYAPGHPRWDRMKEPINWALENGITLKGHPLAWTHRAGTPGYLYDMSPEDSWLVQEARIIMTVKGFPQLTYWDVVNEPANTVTWSMAMNDPRAERRYTREVPLDEVALWVGKAYHAAHRADSSKQLVLNEFMQFADSSLRERYYQLVREMLESGVPIHGLGIQAHEPRAEWYDPVEVWKTLEQYSEFGLPIHITEFSPQSKGAEITGNYRTGNWTEETQAEFTEMMYRIWFGHPSIKSINWWGFSDANAWLPGCGITDEDLNPKPVYRVLEKLIREEWHTALPDLKTDRKGESAFRGYYGKYRVSWTDGQGNEQEKFFHLEEDEVNVWELDW